MGNFQFPHNQESIWQAWLDSEFNTWQKLHDAMYDSEAWLQDNQRALEDYLTSLDFGGSGVPTTPRGFSAYGHGAMSARILNIFTVAAPVVLTQIDAYLQTAPAATDAANHGNVKVSGSVSGTYTMPIDVNGQKEYHAGGLDLITPFGGEVPDAGFSTETAGAIAYSFSLSSSQDLRAIQTLWGGNPPGGAGTGTLRIGIATGMTTATTIATIPWITGPSGPAYVDELISGFSASTSHSTDLGQTVPLAGGVTYQVVIVNQTAGGDAVNTRAKTTGTDSGALANGGDMLETATNGTDARAFSINVGGRKFGDYRLFGAFTGVPLVGLVKLEQTLTGAPATPGSDMNVAIQV